MIAILSQQQPEADNYSRDVDLRDVATSLHILHHIDAYGAIYFFV